MKNYKNGFSAVELLITLFIAAAFLISGYQLYAVVIKDGGEARANARAANAATDYLQQYKSNVAVKNPCSSSNLLTDSPVTVTGLSNTTVSVAITCPYNTTASVSKILVTLKYGTPQQTITNSTYVGFTPIVTNGLVLNLDAANTASYPGTGTNWTDLSGLGNNGTLVNSPTYSATNGGYLSFNGTNNYATVASNSNLSFGTGDFAIQFWTNSTSYSLDTYYRRVLSIGGSGDNATTLQFLFFDGTAASNKISIRNNNQIINGTIIVSNSTWHNIVLTRTGTTLNLYVDKVLDSSTTNSTSFTDGGATTSYIGRYGPLSGGYFSGNISNVLIYNNKSLSSSEVTQNFNALKSRYGL